MWKYSKPIRSGIDDKDNDNDARKYNDDSDNEDGSQENGEASDDYVWTNGRLDMVYEEPVLNSKKVTIYSFPRRIVQLKNEPLFQMTKDEEEMSVWLMYEMTRCYGCINRIMEEYLKRLLKADKIKMVRHNKSNDTYEMFVYNRESGVMSAEAIKTVFLNLQLLAAKTCFVKEYVSVHACWHSPSCYASNS